MGDSGTAVHTDTGMIVVDIDSVWNFVGRTSGVLVGKFQAVLSDVRKTTYVDGSQHIPTITIQKKAEEDVVGEIQTLTQFLSTTEAGVTLLSERVVRELNIKNKYYKSSPVQKGVGGHYRECG